MIYTDNSILDSVRQLGVDVQITDMSTGEISVCPGGGAPSPGRGGRCPDSTLSTVHKGRKTGRTEIYIEGSLLKVAKPARQKTDNPPPGGKRGKITGFSHASKRRLMRTLGKVDKKAGGIPLFVTLTYPENYPANSLEWKKHLKSYFKKLDYRYPGACAIWKLEPQKRGAPHFHLMVWGVSLTDLRNFTPEAWYKTVGSGDIKHFLWHVGVLGKGNKHCVQRVKSWRGVRSYASKYMGKTFDIPGWNTPGRFWGVFHRSNLPWSPVFETDLTYKQAVQLMRYLRRYAHIKGRDYQSLTILVDDPLQWCRLL